MHDRDLLHFVACGSVDDGKSTLIGRLLYDAGLVYQDEIEKLTGTMKGEKTGQEIDYSLLVDGLEAEREQGITIDVAYRYFSTAKRSFVVLDSPGHEQYTRNTATAASKAMLSVLLVDARKGLLLQTRRHSIICSLMGVKHIVLAVNKMDLVSYSHCEYARIVREYNEFVAPLKFSTIIAIPVSARHGDNVVERSTHTPWYRGPTLLSYLEAVDVAVDTEVKPFRFPIQWVNRLHPDFRGYAGTVASGIIRLGDQVVASPGREARVSEIITSNGSLPFAEVGQAVTLTIDKNLDLGRGDILSTSEVTPNLSDHFAAEVIWMDEKPLVQRRSYLARVGTKTVAATITAIKQKLDVNTGAPAPGDVLTLNEIGSCEIATNSPVGFDLYRENRATGCFILIDRMSNATVGAGMIIRNLRPGGNTTRQLSSVSKSQRSLQKHQKAAILWFTGYSGAGKSTIADLVEQRLFQAGYHTMRLDGDDLRQGINRDLGFTEADRVENIRRAAETARLMLEAGLIVLCSFISPYSTDRAMARELVDAGEFIEIFVDTPIEECVRRDPKGLYARAKAGKLVNFTGLDAPYEAPAHPEIILPTIGHDAHELAATVVNYLAVRGIIQI